MANNAQDILLDNTGDIAEVNGDFGVAESDSIHIKHILKADKAHYKWSLITGASIRKKINSPNTELNVTGYLHRLQSQLVYDGYSNIKFDTSNGLANLNIEAIRIK